jgi:hypothetical protein
MPTQVNWRFRQVCNAMFYDGLPSKFAGPPLGFHVGHRAGLIQAVDAIGGDRGVDVPADRGREPRGQAAWIVDFLLLTAQKVPTVAEGLGIGKLLQSAQR